MTLAPHRPQQRQAIDDYSMLLHNAHITKVHVRRHVYGLRRICASVMHHWVRMSLGLYGPLGPYVKQYLLGLYVHPSALVFLRYK